MPEEVTVVDVLEAFIQNDPTLTMEQKERIYYWFESLSNDVLFASFAKKPLH